MTIVRGIHEELNYIAPRRGDIELIFSATTVAGITTCIVSMVQILICYGIRPSNNAGGDRKISDWSQGVGGDCSLEAFRVCREILIGQRIY